MPVAAHDAYVQIISQHYESQMIQFKERITDRVFRVSSTIFTLLDEFIM